MTGKEQEALFRQALSLHDRDSDESSLRAALALYEQAKAAASITLPLAYNIGVLCLDLSQRTPSAVEAQELRLKAASHLDSALELKNNNLEAISARALLEEEFAKNAPNEADVLEHRKEAIRLLEQGTAAEPSDPSVRLSLAEALVLLAEAISEHQSADVATIRDVLQRADAPLREAVWLIDAKLSDLTRMGTDPNAVQQLQSKRDSAVIIRAKVVITAIRLTDVAKGLAARELQQAIDALRKITTSSNDFEPLFMQAELLEALTEQGQLPTEAFLEEAIMLCQRALNVPTTEFSSATEANERKMAAATLLGDLCLDRLRPENDELKATQLVAEGTKSYKAVIQLAENKGLSKPDDVEGITWYNLACLLCIGMAKGCSVEFSEQEIAKFLKNSVDGGGSTLEDLSKDSDLTYMRSKKWFAQLLSYASRRK